MAKKKLNRGTNTGTEQAQQGQEQELNESNDQGTLSEELIDEQGSAGTGATDADAGIPQAGAEGSDEAPQVTQLEEGLVGDESDGKAFIEGGAVPVLVLDEEGNPASAEQVAASGLRGETSVIAHLDELPFLPPAGDEPATLGEGAQLTDEEIATAVAQLPEGTAVRDGANISDKPLSDIIPEPLQDTAERLADITARDMLDGHPETLVSEEEQAASTAALLAQEPQPEPGNEFKPADPEQSAAHAARFDIADAISVQPVIDPTVGGQIGFLPLDKWTVPDLRASLVEKVGADAAAAWSREQMLTFIETGAYPNKTTRGNWIYDARRTHNTKAWNASELSDFIEGKLLLDRSVDESLVWEEAYARYRAPTNWTIEAFRQFVCDNTRPEVTASGVLLEDRMREQKQAHHLTFRELRAAALGEIEVPHTREDVLSHLRKRLGLSDNHSEERMLAQLPGMTNEVSMDNTFLSAKLEEYKAAMTRNPATLSEETAGAAQGMLYDAVRKVIKREYNEFVEGWNIILDFVNENHVALFDPYKARRGWSQVPLGKQQLALFEDLLTLIIRTREPGNRAAAAKLYNLEIVLRHMPNENERQNLFLYYSAS